MPSSAKANNLRGRMDESGNLQSSGPPPPVRPCEPKPEVLTCRPDRFKDSIHCASTLDQGLSKDYKSLRNCDK